MTTNSKQIFFAPARREQLYLKMALTGASGNGKTFTGLSILTHMLGEAPHPSFEKKIVVLESENGKAALYSEGAPFYFSMGLIQDFSPDSYLQAVQCAIDAGFTHALIDNITDEWEYCLAEVDRLKKGADARSAWGQVTPRHAAFLRGITKANIHLVATILSKPHYETVDDEARPGKKKQQRVGMAPIMREGFERLFDIAGDMREEAELAIFKTRCSSLFSRVIRQPGRELAEEIKQWLEKGDQVPYSVDEMLAILVERGSLGKDALKEARATLTLWCAARNVQPDGIVTAQERLGQEVRALVARRKVGSDVTPPSADAPPA